MSSNPKNYKELARQARLKVLEMVFRGQTSHIASNFSVIDIATVLYENLKPEDEVVWSAGWKAATIYYFLAQQGKIPKADLDRFAKEEDGKIEYLGLAETTTPGVWVNGGSVGQGLSLAAGMAYAKKLKGEKGTIYCIMSDGELDEGTVWEAARVAARLKLNNLVAIIDQNGWQALGRTEDVNGGSPRDAFGAFGWTPVEIDGHNHEEIEVALRQKTQKPFIIIAETVKGSGGDTACNIFEKGLLYHYKHVDEETYRTATELLSKDKMSTLSS